MSIFDKYIEAGLVRPEEVAFDQYENMFIKKDLRDKKMKSLFSHRVIGTMNSVNRNPVMNTTYCDSRK
jgi:hypothetical protein